MEPIDYCSWFDTRPAEFAALSTFNFDPAFFEHRLLQRSKALANARRVLVLMDAGQFRLLLAEGRPARWLNRRYLVVPIEKPGGVFHPKLHLLLAPTGADVLCGSNNLTAPGCTGNLELVNRVRVPVHNGQLASATAHVARQARRFFGRCLEYGVSAARDLAAQWLDDVKTEFEGLATDAAEEQVHDIELVHTLAGGDWPTLDTMARGGTPARLIVVSPFYDTDLALLRRVGQQWPNCRVEIHAQDRHSHLPAEMLPDVCPEARLFNVDCENRRLHAKLIAWQVGESLECIVGSANFTTAAWDRRNVEACLRLRKAGRLVGKLFGNEVRRRAMRPDDFTAGPEEEPKPIPLETDPLPRVASACLGADGVLRVHYMNPLHPRADALLLELADWKAQQPLLIERVPCRREGTFTTTVRPESLAGCHGALTVSLTAQIGEERCVGLVCWVIQEGSLTRQATGEARDSVRRQIEETGWGLAKHIAEMLQEAKIDEVIEYLRHLRIRFTDGAPMRTGWSSRRYAYDPYRPDTPADWLTRLPGVRRQDLWTAILDFAEPPREELPAPTRPARELGRHAQLPRRVCHPVLAGVVLLQAPVGSRTLAGAAGNWSRLPVRWSCRQIPGRTHGKPQGGSPARTERLQRDEFRRPSTGRALDRPARPVGSARQAGSGIAAFLFGDRNASDGIGVGADP